jgi:hypothetical protein
MSPKDLHFADEETLEALEEAYFDVLGEHGGVIFGEIVEDVPLFVEHCEAVAARLTLRGVGLTSKNAIG